MDVIIDTDGSGVAIFRGWLQPLITENMDYLYDVYSANLEYEQPLIRQIGTGKIIPMPRLKFAAGDCGLESHKYCFAGTKFSSTAVKMIDWTNAQAPIAGIRYIRDLIASDQELMRISNNSIPNSCHYRNGNDSVSLHADKELKDPSQTVYTITLGEPRPFRLVHNNTLQKVDVTPGSGDLLFPVIIMTGNTQTYWKHEIPKRSANKYKNGRISLTYRVL